MTTHKLPLLPLKNVAVYPELIQALIVGRPASLASIQAALEGDSTVVTVLQKEPDDEHPAREALYDVGTISKITRVEQRDGGAQVIVRGLRRARLGDLTATEDEVPLVEAAVEELPTPALPAEGEERAKATALMRENLDIAKRVAQIMSQNPATKSIQQLVGHISEPCYCRCTASRNCFAPISTRRNSSKTRWRSDEIQPLALMAAGQLAC